MMSTANNNYASQISFTWEGKKALETVSPSQLFLIEEHGEQSHMDDSRLILGDNLQVLGTLLDDYKNSVDLIYIDPPYNSKADYYKKVSLKRYKEFAYKEWQYKDNWKVHEYLQFMYERLTLLRSLLSDRGSIYVHCDWHVSHHMRMLLDEVFGAKNFNNEIIWSYNSGGGSAKRFARKHDNIFYYVKDINNYYFDGESSRVPYSAVIPKKYKHNYSEKGKNCPDVWNISRPPNHSKKLSGYPTQKPNELLERIIMSSSPKGGLVLDAFAGSGTSLEVANNLGRKFIGIDNNPFSINASSKRLLESDANFKVFSLSEQTVDSSPFELHLKVEGQKLLVLDFSDDSLLEALGLELGGLRDWQLLVDSIQIDFFYDGQVFKPQINDFTTGDDFVKGEYNVPANHGDILIKIVDIRSKSFFYLV